MKSIYLIGLLVVCTLVGSIRAQVKKLSLEDIQAMEDLNIKAFLLNNPYVKLDDFLSNLALNEARRLAQVIFERLILIIKNTN